MQPDKPSGAKRRPLKNVGGDGGKASKQSPKGIAPHASPLWHVRWIALIIAIGLIAISLTLSLQPSLLPKSSSLASDAFGKVGIVLFCVWLAWPAVEMIWQSPSGAVLILASVLVLGLFIYRPKTIFLTGPFLAIAVGLALLLGWLRKMKR